VTGAYEPPTELVDILDEVIVRGRRDAARLYDQLEAAAALRSAALDAASRTDTLICNTDSLIVHARDEQDRARLTALAARLNPTERSTQP